MFYKNLAIKFLLIFIFSVISSCNIPKDPENSWEKIQRDGLKVGVVINSPYAFQKESLFTGSEVKLLKKFAKENNLKIKFITENETYLVRKLENYEIDILIGGFTKKTIWTKKVGKSTPYDEEAHVFLIPKGENKLLHVIESFIFNLKKK